MPIKVRADFKTLQELDRYRKIKLGQPIPIDKNKEIPWGYKQDPDNEKMALPDDRALRMLLKVSEYSDQYSLRDLAAWVASAGYPISHVALDKIIKSRLPFKEILLPLEERMKL